MGTFTFHCQMYNICIYITTVVFCIGSREGVIMAPYNRPCTRAAKRISDQQLHEHKLFLKRSLINNIKSIQYPEDGKSQLDTLCKYFISFHQEWDEKSMVSATTIDIQTRRVCIHLKDQIKYLQKNMNELQNILNEMRHVLNATMARTPLEFD